MTPEIVWILARFMTRCSSWEAIWSADTERDPVLYKESFVAWTSLHTVVLFRLSQELGVFCCLVTDMELKRASISDQLASLKLFVSLTFSKDSSFCFRKTSATLLWVMIYLSSSSPWLVHPVCVCEWIKKGEKSFWDRKLQFYTRITLICWWRKKRNK